MISNVGNVTFELKVQCTNFGGLTECMISGVEHPKLKLCTFVQCLL